MKTVWKFPVQMNSSKNDLFRVEFDGPYGARPISVGLQGGATVLWAEVDTEHEIQRQHVYIVGTGHGIVPDHCRFVGTVQQGPYVWHVYSPVP